MEKELYLSAENLEAIKEAIQLELLKRGVTAPIVTMEETIGRNSSSHYINFSTAYFQTVPVMFKKLAVTNFSTSANKQPKSVLDPKLAGEFIAVWISVHFSYESFGGGSNGTEIFNIWFNVFGPTSYDVKLAQIR